LHADRGSLLVVLARRQTTVKPTRDAVLFLGLVPWLSALPVGAQEFDVGLDVDDVAASELQVSDTHLGIEVHDATGRYIVTLDRATGEELARLTISTPPRQQTWNVRLFGDRVLVHDMLFDARLGDRVAGFPSGRVVAAGEQIFVHDPQKRRLEIYRGDGKIVRAISFRKLKFDAQTALIPASTGIVLTGQGSVARITAKGQTAWRTKPGLPPHAFISGIWRVSGRDRDELLTCTFTSAGAPRSRTFCVFSKGRARTFAVPGANWRLVTGDVVGCGPFDGLFRRDKRRYRVVSLGSGASGIVVLDLDRCKEVARYEGVMIVGEGYALVVGQRKVFDVVTGKTVLEVASDYDVTLGRHYVICTKGRRFEIVPLGESDGWKGKLPAGCELAEGYGCNDPHRFAFWPTTSADGPTHTGYLDVRTRKLRSLGRVDPRGRPKLHDLHFGEETTFVVYAAKEDRSLRVRSRPVPKKR